MGKTVLLNEIKRSAEGVGYHTVFIEACESKTLGSLLVPCLWSLFFDLDRMAGAGDKVKRGLAVLRSFVSGLRLAVEILVLGWTSIHRRDWLIAEIWKSIFLSCSLRLVRQLKTVNLP